MTKYPESRSHTMPQTVSRGLLVVLRVYLGVVLLVAGWSKLTGDTSFTPRMIGFVENVGLESGYPFFQGFLRGVVLPNAGFFAGLVAWGELFGGLALVTGTATRLTSAVVILMLGGYLLTKGATLWQTSSNDAPMMFIALVLMLGGAGRMLGVDRYLAEKWPKVLLW
jgi:thiosulfate dehydrogenase [quinone] large subunit